MLIRTLKDDIHIIDEAEDGLIAINKVLESIKLQSPYDLILMDNIMPNMTGPDATRKIRELGYTGIIFGVTGNVLESDLTNFKNHGANEVLPKPTDLITIEHNLKRK
jgi:CheY-like chemotaxis protein